MIPRPWSPATPLLLVVVAACGGGSAAYRVSYEDRSRAAGGEGREEADMAVGSGSTTVEAPPPPAPPAMEPAPAMERMVVQSSAPGVSGPDLGGVFGFSGQVDEDRRIAQESPAHRAPAASRPAPQNVPPQQAHDANQTASDATSGPLLIYQAVLHLAVYQVQDNQRAVIAIARELGGFLAQQSDNMVVVRIPVAKFNEAIGRVEALGDVLHRNIQATDVSEEFRDLAIRLRNMEQVRDRLAALLAQARTVEESLQIERELERLTTQIESMKGRLRFLEDRIAFSTITVNFSPRESESLQGELFNLPFDFLYNMGLRPLLNLR